MHRYVYYVTVTHVDSVEMLMAVKWFTVINITFASLVGTPVQVRRHAHHALMSDIETSCRHTSLGVPGVFLSTLGMLLHPGSQSLCDWASCLRIVSTLRSQILLHNTRSREQI